MAASQAACPACGTFLTITHGSTVSVVCKRCNAVLEWRGGELRQAGGGAVVVPTRTTVPAVPRGPTTATDLPSPATSH